MFGRRGWFGGWGSKNRNLHSTEHLKHLYGILCRNQIVTEHNKDQLVETLRSISEILIWGDQNDGSVFDFFLEKNMLSFFVKIMQQKQGRYVCTQLLQTLNILFENIRQDTSLYYLLSNNHVNSIIEHRFDFSDEEVMAYYISFIKTLSLKLTSHTIHFFYNEHTNDFPLYTEAIKFFKHSESMVRIAVRTLTLNVFRVNDVAMQKFICDKTAVPYFSNLVWFIGKNVLELDACAANADHQVQARLADLVAEHLDHLHYLNDILCLNIEPLNEVLTDHLLNRLFLPLYIYSLTDQPTTPRTSPHVSRIVALFLLNQVFLIMSHKPLVRQLAEVLFDGTMDIFDPSKSCLGYRPEFIPPDEPLELSLQSGGTPCGSEGEPEVTPGNSFHAVVDVGREETRFSKDKGERSQEVEVAEEAAMHSGSNITDEEKIRQQGIPLEAPPEPSSNQEEPADSPSPTSEVLDVADPATPQTEAADADFDFSQRPFLKAIFDSLSVEVNDHAALFALSLLYALGHNSGINQELLDSVLIPPENSKSKSAYNNALMNLLMRIVKHSCVYGTRVRLATLEMAILLIKQLAVIKSDDSSASVSCLREAHLELVKRARDESALLLKGFLKSEEIFLDMFEEEYEQLKGINVEYLTMDGNLLLPPIGTPMSGMDFHKRLPCGEVERAIRAIRAFFLIRHLCLELHGEKELELPLTKEAELVKVDQILDLTNNDLVGCNVINTKDGSKVKRFMVIDSTQIILVEPEASRLGFGVVKLAGLLQDIEVTGDQNDSRALNITIHRSCSTKIGSMATHSKSTLRPPKRPPLLAAKFIFDDHIRCMAAKQKLSKGRLRARQKKMQQIAKLLDMNISSTSPSGAPSGVGPLSANHRKLARSGSGSTSSESSQMASRGSATEYAFYEAQKSFGSNRLVEVTVRPKIPGSAVPAFSNRNQDKKRIASQPVEIKESHRKNRSLSRSRESSPRAFSLADEEIPLEDMSAHSSPRFPRGASPMCSPTKQKSRMGGLLSPSTCDSSAGASHEAESSGALDPSQMTARDLCETSLDQLMVTQSSSSLKGQVYDI
ncbi:protein CLEC16A [Galendromus occidentalis]|uniref:Protein CLEC16A n=1 Tax=Galendromus occidentalis TaxID=34638 RepID=A0AAJ7SFE1_9ACAR|nr:protein CLEC16A [Galendromus occidentalis]